MFSKGSISTIIGVLSIMLLSGCGTAIDNLSAFKQHHMEKAELMPSQKLLAGEKLKVIIMSVEDAGFATAKSANLGNALTRMLESEIGRDQAINILDRSATKKFADEIKLDEMNGVSTGENILLDSANYAVVGELKNASFTSRFVARSSWIDDKGRRHVIPSHYIYTAEVDGQIKIYELPSMKIVKIIPFSDNKNRNEDSRFLGSRTYVDHGLVNKAGEDAIHAARIELKNFLAPRGYLIGGRSLDGDRIIKISLGSKNGILEGDSIEIFTKKKVVNQLTDEITIEKYKVGFATVSDKIQEKSAWAHLDEEVEGESVRLGDEVKVIYSKGFMDYVNDAGKYANSLSK